MGNRAQPPARASVQLQSQSVAGKEVGLPDLDPQLSTAEVRDIAASFDWKTTKALRETTEQGEPALYYARVYVTSREEVKYLDQAHIHHSTLPLFQFERASYRGKVGRVRPPNDGKGALIYAVIPGKIYNVIRAQALQGDALFQGIQLVPNLPAAVLGKDGALSWDALQASRFHYQGVESVDLGSNTPGLGSSKQPLVILTVRLALKYAAEAGEEVLRAIARAAGDRDRNGLVFGWGAAGSAPLIISTDLRETDGDFGGTLPQANSGQADASRPMRRAWGQHAGQPVTLPGVRISVWSEGDSTVLWLPTLFEGTTNDEGKAHLDVAQDRTVSDLCLATENDSAEITDFLTEIEVCDFKSFATGKIDDLQNLSFVDVKIQDSYFNVLGQTTEAREYFRQIVGYTPHQAVILVGGVADMLGVFNGHTAFTPCLGFPNVSADGLVAAILGATALLSPTTAVALGASTPLMAVDMVLPKQSEITNPARPFDQRTTDSRGVPTHEYGHFATCSLLYDSSVDKISGRWTAAMISRVSGGADPQPDSERAYVIEALADFFASQIVGGTNYPRLGQSKDWAGFSYCPASSSCMDQNVKWNSTLPDSTPFDVQVARVATTLQDAFDGAIRWRFGWPQDLPGNGNIWKKNGSLWEFANTDAGDVRAGDAVDDPVTLPGSAIQELVQRTGLTEGGIMSSLAATVMDHGYNWCDTCEVFAPHDEKLTMDTVQNRYAVCEQQPIAGWLPTAPNHNLPQSCNFVGCPDGKIPNYGDNTCVACPAGQVEVDGRECQACPAGTTVINNQCQTCDAGGTQCSPACPGRTQLENGVCTECPWEQVQVNGVCEPCPAGLLRQENECVAVCEPCGDEVIIDRGVCVCQIN